MPESNLNRKEGVQSSIPNREVVVYSYSEQKPKSPLGKIIDFFSSKKTATLESSKPKLELPDTLLHFDQPIEIIPIANTVTTPTFAEELTAQHPKITEAVKIITTDISAIRETHKLVKEAHIPNPNKTIVQAIQEQFKRENLKDIAITLRSENNQSEFKVELEFAEKDETPQKIFISDIG